jgi:hypothetical protein
LRRGYTKSLLRQNHWKTAPSQGPLAIRVTPRLAEKAENPSCGPRAGSAIE